MDVITTFPTYFVAGLHQIDPIYGVIIALFFGIATATVVGVIISPILAAIVYIAAKAIIPPLIHHAALVMPAFDKALVKEGLVLYVAFLVAIAVVFAVKKAILSLRH